MNARAWGRRIGAVLLGVVLLNVGWNVTGSMAITPNSPAPVVYTVVSR